MSIFNSCKIEAPFDEMFDKNCNVKPHWKEIYDNLERVGIKQLEQKQIEIDWLT